MIVVVVVVIIIDVNIVVAITAVVRSRRERETVKRTINRRGRGSERNNSPCITIVNVIIVSDPQASTDIVVKCVLLCWWSLCVYMVCVADVWHARANKPHKEGAGCFWCKVVCNCDCFCNKDNEAVM